MGSAQVADRDDRVEGVRLEALQQRAHLGYAIPEGRRGTPALDLRPRLPSPELMNRVGLSRAWSSTAVAPGKSASVLPAMSCQAATNATSCPGLTVQIPTV